MLALKVGGVALDGSGAGGVWRGNGAEGRWSGRSNYARPAAYTVSIGQTIFLLSQNHFPT